MNLKVRLYRDEDFEATWPLFEQVSRFYHGSGAPSGDRMRTYVEERVLGPDSDVRLALVLEDGDPVGMATFAILHPGPRTTGQLQLKEIFIAEDRRGRGAGKAMMKFLADFALRNGCSRFDWTGETTNPDGLEFYRSLGVEPLEEKVYFRLSGEALQRFAER